MHDVARVAGVSQMTVSRVMRGSGYISKDVKTKVEDAARSIGYIHNRLAGGMAGYDNPLVGVIVPTLQNRVFTEVLSGVSDALNDNGLRPVFGVSEYSMKREEELVFDLLSWRPRGLILAGLEHTEAMRKIIQQTGVRVAEIMDIDGDPIAASFGISQGEAGEHMADHLLSKGYETFGYIANLAGMDLRAEKRFAGFRRRIEDAGRKIVDQRISSDELTMLDGKKLTASLLEQSNPPQAIYYSNDDLAAGGLMHCLAEGIEVPKDVALAGFNGLGFLEAMPMQITTIRTPRYEIGRAAAEWIVSGKEQTQDPVRHEFNADLISGETS
ncbi:MAG: LacI family DNA-binding transcriptional regulator [Hyphomicrobiales bacterium]